MKKLIFVLLVLFLFCTLAKSQFQFGIKAGIHSVDLASEGITLPNSNGQSIELNFLQSKYGFHFGIYTRLSFLGIYIEPAAILNSTSINFSFQEIEDQGVVDVIRNETYNKLDIPVLIGVKGGLIRLFAGPVAHIHINSASDLVDFPGYERMFEQATYGFQGGIGLDLWKLRIEAVFESNLSKFGDHIFIDGQAFNFDRNASRLIFSAGYKF